jgi:5'-3' exonuclease
VRPPSIPDYLALVGDSADGFPGLDGWGAKSAGAVLARYGHLEDIPDAPGQWDVGVRNAARLARTLATHRDEAYLFRTLATLRTDCEVGQVDDWRWTGPTDALPAMADRLDQPDLLRRIEAVARRRG